MAQVDSDQSRPVIWVVSCELTALLVQAPGRSLLSLVYCPVQESYIAVVVVSLTMVLSLV